MHLSQPLAVAIDGPVASGKTVVGRLVAHRLEIRFLDSGNMYRALTWLALQRGTGLEEAEALTSLARDTTMRLEPTAAPDDPDQAGGERLLIGGRDVTDSLTDPDVERGVSLVAAVSGVRVALVEQQRDIASQGSIVMVGRDIGTVVLPHATVKVYLEASVRIRARRRLLDLERRGDRVDYEQIVKQTIRRDTIDSERADSPLRPAKDAIRIYTDDMEVEELVEVVLGHIGHS